MDYNKKIQLGDSTAIIINDIVIKNHIINYLYNSINIKSYRYHVLKNIQKLEFLQKNPHYVSPNYYGNNYYTIFTTINDVKYCCLVDKNNLAYDRKDINIKKIKIIKVHIYATNDVFRGSIMETKIIKNTKNNKHIMLINDIFILMGNKLLDMEMKSKIKYMNTIINQNFKSKNGIVCENFKLMVNSLFEYNDLPDLINDKMKNCPYNIHGLVFYPKYSGITTIYSDKKQQKIEINSTNNEVIKTTSYDLIVNLPEFLKARNYSYETIGKTKELFIKRTSIRDVYSVFENINDKRLGIACIPNMKISHMCNTLIDNEPIKFKCKYNNKFNKWIPIKKIN